MEKVLLEKLLKVSKLIIVLLLAILIVLIIGVSKMYPSNSSNTNTETETTEEYNTDYDVSTFKEISANKLKTETKDKLSVVYIGRETCGWCAAFLPNLWKAQEDYNFTTLYIDIAKIIDFNNNTISDEDAYNLLMKLTGTGYENYMEENLGATPMILIMKDNKIVGAQTGYSEYDSFESVLTELGLKK